MFFFGMPEAGSPEVVEKGDPSDPEELCRGVGFVFWPQRWPLWGVTFTHLTTTLRLSGYPTGRIHGGGHIYGRQFVDALSFPATHPEARGSKRREYALGGGMVVGLVCQQGGGSSFP